MREHPILFSAAMVNAILDGRKTMTRRVINPQPDSDGFSGFNKFGDAIFYPRNDDSNDSGLRRCPYGQPGDRLWVRETWAIGDRDGDVVYAADKEWHINGVAIGPRCNRGTRWEDCWRPSIHMPRWASRIDLEIADIRVERLQDISNNDALAEGTPDNRTLANNYELRDCFRELWDSINLKRGYGWDANPWVWAITLKLIKRGS